MEPPRPKSSLDSTPNIGGKSTVERLSLHPRFRATATSAAAILIVRFTCAP